MQSAALSQAFPPDICLRNRMLTRQPNRSTPPQEKQRHRDLLPVLTARFASDTFRITLSPLAAFEAWTQPLRNWEQRVVAL
eukprot:6183036-Pleurochrysis_carterae.AAC.3